MTRLFEEACSSIAPLDRPAATATLQLMDRLTKPPGSLGRLEALAVHLAAISGESPPPVPEPAVVAVFAGDHGVLAEDVTPWPPEVTGQMVVNFLAGGAAINVFSRHAGAEVVVVDVGVASELTPAPGLVDSKIRPGTGNLATEPAMSRAEALAALDAGVSVANRLIEEGVRCLITGDMGIGNTTPSAALIAGLTGRPVTEVTGRGTGIDDEHWARKVSAITRGLARTADPSDPLELLASVGGLEIAALAGFAVAGAARRVPVVIDGVIALAGCLVAYSLAPGCRDYLIAGHRSTEPGATAALEHLGLEPLIDLGLRLGEGTGACLALSLVQASAKMAREMATFDSAGVTDKSS